MGRVKAEWIWSAPGVFTFILRMTIHGCLYIHLDVVVPPSTLSVSFQFFYLPEAGYVVQRDIQIAAMPNLRPDILQ